MFSAVHNQRSQNMCFPLLGTFHKNYFYQFILVFSLFLLLFIDSIAVFGTIYESYYTVLANVFSIKSFIILAK